MSHFPLESVRTAFRAAAVAFVPELDRADSAVWSRLEQTVAAALADRPPVVTRQLRLFVRLLDTLAVLTRGRRLAGLDPARRAAFLHGLERWPLLLARRGLWGLRTMVFLGYYTQPEIVAGLGYAASPAGWEARR